MENNTFTRESVLDLLIIGAVGYMCSIYFLGLILFIFNLILPMGPGIMAGH